MEYALARNDGKIAIKVGITLYTYYYQTSIFYACFFFSSSSFPMKHTSNVKYKIK